MDTNNGEKGKIKPHFVLFNGMYIPAEPSPGSMLAARHKLAQSGRQPVVRAHPDTVRRMPAAFEGVRVKEI